MKNLKTTILGILTRKLNEAKDRLGYAREVVEIITILPAVFNSVVKSERFCSNQQEINVSQTNYNKGILEAVRSLKVLHDETAAEPESEHEFDEGDEPESGHGEEQDVPAPAKSGKRLLN